MFKMAWYLEESSWILQRR